MGLYEGIKDVAKVVQQADNIELYRQLLDLSAQALDLQAENGQLKEDKWIPNPVNDSAYGDDRGILSVDGRTIFLLGATQITAYNATDLAQLGTYTYPDFPLS